MEQQQEAEQCYFDVTRFLGLGQKVVAKALGVPDSTFSKRWIEANGGQKKKWPHRSILHCDRAIASSLKNLIDGGDGGDDEEKIEHIARAILERNALFTPTSMRLPSF